MKKTSEKRIDIPFIKKFTPAWFSVVMGTGIFAVTSLYYSQYIDWLKEVGKILSYFNAVTFAILLIPWILRWIIYPKEALEDIRNPVIANFYPTMPIGLIVLSVNFLVILNNPLTAKILFFIGAILTVVFSIIIPLIMFFGKHVKLDHISPAWFIPPVSLIAIPIPGGLLLNSFNGFAYEFVLMLNIFGWGAGFFMYLALFAIALYRFILHHPLPNTLAPTIWINLGPIGAGIVALFNIVNNWGEITVKEPFYIFGALFWGLGLWWTIAAITMTLVYMSKVKVPYTMSWWAFIFPLGVFVAASHIIGMLLNISLLNYIGFALYWLLVILWVLTFILTILKNFQRNKKEQ